MKSALVIGASRGIGRQMAITLSRNGYQVGVAAKTVESTPELPGSIYTVSQEIEDLGGKAIPLKCNVRNSDDVDSAVKSCVQKFGGLDYAIYNAGAIKWDKVLNTPLKTFHLLDDVNLRGSYSMIQSVLPHMLERKAGRILLVAPPIYNRFFKGKTPYSATKVGMTVLVHGLAMELQGTGVSVSALWPATAIDSFVMEKLNVPSSQYRTAHIFADATLAIGQETTEKYNGKALIDEDMLRENGVTDFTKYRADTNHEPKRMMPLKFPSLLVEEEEYDPIFKSKL